jgi:dihydrofolate synthase/folylpolyglutamate synthase
MREWLPADEVLFHERSGGRARGQRRSLARAAVFATHLGVDLEGLNARPQDVISVVGSKGKGTAATYASATLAAAGLRVGTITSPGLRSNRERIRVDGRAIDAESYLGLIEKVRCALDDPPGELPDDGYLSPTGLFTIAGLHHFQEQGCEAIVVEAGMGGASDEVSLLTPGVLAVGAVFEEHLGLIGNDLREIVRDKLGAAKEGTHSIVLAAGAAALVPEEARRRAADIGAALHVVDARTHESLPHPDGLSATNAAVGIEAGMRLLQGRDLGVAHHRLAETLASVALPGRLSIHRHAGRDWMVDFAVNRAAASVALGMCREHLGEPGTVLLCLPAGKDRAGVEAVLGGLPVQRVRVDAPHLDFTGWEDAPLLDEMDVTALDGPVLALGTIYFGGSVLALLDADCEVSFSAAR